jgi:hypothetical protein
MTLVKPGDHLRSRVCTTEVIVVRAAGVDTAIACGGEPMVGQDEPVTPAANGAATNGAGTNGTATNGAAADAPGTLLGKRYADDESGLELLCVKGGSGQLSVAGRVLRPREARPLPASD